MKTVAKLYESFWTEEIDSGRGKERANQARVAAAHVMIAVGLHVSLLLLTFSLNSLGG